MRTRTLTGVSTEVYTQHGDGYRSYRHELRAVNGRFTVDQESY